MKSFYNLFKLTSLGIYIHWPWCKNICPYCDFNVAHERKVKSLDWADAYIKEIHNVSSFTENRTVSSIYFGGGTPSLMDPLIIENVINYIYKKFKIYDGCEISMEVNPSSINKSKLKDFKLSGVNRISLGVQSLNDKELKFLGRDHSSEQAKTAILETAKLFNRANLDAIYGLPNQTLDNFKENLKLIFNYANILGHLSIYQLTIEKATPFYKLFKNGKIILPHNNNLADMYEIIQEETDKINLSQYEISNHSFSGHESIHNLGYWRYNEYLGIGPGAHSRVSYDNAKRALIQKKKPNNWLDSVLNNKNGIDEINNLSNKETALEVLITGLRLKEYLPYSRFDQFSPQPLKEIIKSPDIKDLIDNKYLEISHSKIKTTKKGKMVLNTILYKFEKVLSLF